MRKNGLFIYISITAIVLLVCFASCERSLWEEYYDYDDRVDITIWEALEEEERFSSFLELLEHYGMDTLFDKQLSHTLFVPNNAAFADLSDTAGIMRDILYYHISSTVFLVRNIDGERKLQNLTGKFAPLSRTDTGYSYDMIPIEYTSPLYLDGVYYELSKVAIPRPNLYEFTERFSQVIKKYIDLSDSVFLNKSLSTPIDFDDNGNTVYDSVFESINVFEREFFPVSNEYRDKEATFVLFTQEQYDFALDEMANNLGPTFSNHNDIPTIWQYNILLPTLMENSLFPNDLEYSQFTDQMLSVTGDSVNIEPGNINPESRFLCSNGVTYTYDNFTVPIELYAGEVKIEGEAMVDSIGPTSYLWKSEYIDSVWGQYFIPERGYNVDASEAYNAGVSFGQNYNGEWGLTVVFKNMFPMKYRLEWRANYRPSGVIRVSVNDRVLSYKDKFGDEYESFDTYYLRNSVTSVTGDLFIPDGSFNRRDYWVEDLSEFGDIKITFEYLGPGFSTTNGFNIDYIALIPEE